MVAFNGVPVSKGKLVAFIINGLNTFNVPLLPMPSPQTEKTPSFSNAMEE